MTLNFPDMLARRSGAFTVLTYNVHSCVGTDRKLDPYRVADVIAASGADIIALQELDVGRKRTGGVDQAELIASILKMDCHFHPALTVLEERYGDAILTALPSRLVKAGPLPSIGETRGALWVSIDISGIGINVLNTHLGLRGRDRLQQTAALLGPDWIGSEAFQAAPSIACGDFNAGVSSPVNAMMGRYFRNAQQLANRRVARTFPSRMPLLGIDHIYISEGIGVMRSAVISGPSARRASDHLPLFAELTVQPPNAVSPDVRVSAPTAG